MASINRFVALSLIVTLHAGYVPAQTADKDPVAEKQKCVTEHAHAQVLRRNSQLSAARDALFVCSQEVCPTAVRKDCLTWLEAVATSIPSVIVRGKVNGVETTEARLFIDGKAISSALDGKAIELDPGLHKFRLEHSATEIVEQDVLLNEGQTSYVLLLEINPPKPVVLPPPVQPTPYKPPVVERRGPVPVLSYVLGGVALLGAGGFAGAALWGMDERKSLQGDCAPGCTAKEVQKVRTKFIIADVSLGVGILAALGAGYVYFTRPNETLPASAALPGFRTSTTTALDFVAAPSGAVLSVRGLL